MGYRARVLVRRRYRAPIAMPIATRESRRWQAGKGEGQLLISRGKEQGRKPSRRRDRIYLRFQPRSLNSPQAPQPHRPLSPTATKLRLATRPPGPSSTLLEAPRSFLRTAEANLHRLSFNRARGVRVIPRLAQRAPYRVGTNAPREQVTSRKTLAARDG